MLQLQYSKYMVTLDCDRDDGHEKFHNYLEIDILWLIGDAQKP